MNLVDNKGVIVTTLAQTMFDEHKDYVEKDEYGNVIGMWADYYDSVIEPVNISEQVPFIHGIITHSGPRPEIKSGGSYKKLTITFYDDNNEPIQTNYDIDNWSFEILGMNGQVCTCDDWSTLVTFMATESSVINGCQCMVSNDLNDNQIKVKFIKDDTYLHHILLAKYVDNTIGVDASLQLEIVGL